ncbi:MAG TPA: sulfate adenylyltransferase, partial [Saprospirales bacterium]|nr:sulfate adenylyltransferase [Saprospirales bacterium]
SQEQYDKIKTEFEQFASKLDVVDVSFIPISALNGDNVVSRSMNM